MKIDNKKYKVVKIRESLHTIIKHRAVDRKTSIQEIVEKALLLFLKINEPPVFQTKSIIGKE